MAKPDRNQPPKIVDGKCVVPNGWVCYGSDCGHSHDGGSEFCWYKYRCPICGGHPNECQGPVAMKHGDFSIGKKFRTATGEWLCTDVGTRVIAAIKIDDLEDASWAKGPPYAVQETVFDENDFGGCQPAEAKEDAANV